MKTLFFILLIIPAVVFGQEKSIEWISLNEAEKRMEKEPKKVLIDVYTQWCGPCKMMNQTTFNDPEIVEYINKNYYAVKFDAEGSETIHFKGNVYQNEGYDPNRRGRNSTHDLTKAIAPLNGRIAYPTIVYMNEEFKILSPVQGYQRPEQIMPILTFFGEDVYESTSWEEYLQNYN